MKTLFTGIFFFMILFCGYSWAEKPIIDPEFKAIQEQMRAEQGACAAKEKNIGRRMKCSKAIYKQYLAKGLLRGTDEYCEKHYSSLGYDDLQTVLEKTMALKREARILPPGNEAQLGEVGYDKLQIEEYWIKFRLGDMQKEHRVKLEKEVFKE